MTLPMGHFFYISKSKHTIEHSDSMSYTLEDLINSLAQDRSYQRQPQPQPPAFYPQQFYYPYDQEDDEDEDAYYARYPDYYSPFSFYGQDPRRAHAIAQAQAAQAAQAAAAKRAAQEEAARKLQERRKASRSQEGEGESSADDILDILAQLTGIPKSQFNVQTPQPKPQETKSDGEKKQESKKAEDEQAEQAEQKGEPKTIKEPKVAPEIRENITAAKPSSKRRHSTASFKEPEPKVEISQRNFKNPTVPYSPQSNVYDTEKEYVVVLAIPGASLKDLDIDFHPSTNEIVVKGSIPDPFSEKGIKFNEIRTGNIERRFKFPALPKINDEQIKAKYVNGLLTIRIPKSEEKQVKPKRKVTIEEVPDEELVYEEHGGLVQ